MEASTYFSWITAGINTNAGFAVVMTYVLYCRDKHTQKRVMGTAQARAIEQKEAREHGKLRQTEQRRFNTLRQEYGTHGIHSFGGLAERRQSLLP